MLLKYKNQKFNGISARNGDYLDVSITGKPSDFLINKISNNEFRFSIKTVSPKPFLRQKMTNIFMSLRIIFSMCSMCCTMMRTFFSGDSLSDDKHENILSPMPGSIVKVVVKVGDKVEEGDAVNYY